LAAFFHIQVKQSSTLKLDQYEKHLIHHCSYTGSWMAAGRIRLQRNRPYPYPYYTRCCFSVAWSDQAIGDKIKKDHEDAVSTS